MFAARKAVAALVALFGVSCGGQGSMDEAQAPDESAQVSQNQEVSKKVYGTFVSDSATAGQFVRLVLLTDGRFHAEQSVVCFNAPCEPVVVEGNFKLHVMDGMDCVQLNDSDGAYLDDLPYRYVKSVLNIEPTMGAPEQQMNRGAAWCAQVADCKVQNLYTPAAVGSWGCESNTCKWHVQSEATE